MSSTSTSTTTTTNTNAVTTATAATAMPSAVSLSEMQFQQLLSAVSSTAALQSGFDEKMKLLQEDLQREQRVHVKNVAKKRSRNLSQHGGGAGEGEGWLHLGNQLVDWKCKGQVKNTLSVVDRSDYGWLVVLEYETDKLADDENGEKRIGKAVKQAEKKAAEAKRKNSTAGLSRGTVLRFL